MDIKDFYMFYTGFVKINVEGFFVERFVNSCFANNIMVLNLQREKNTYLRMKILAKDFKKIRKIARKTKCKVKIENKKGLPILMNKYKKRKAFFISVLIILSIVFVSTRFVWNIEIEGNKNISSEEILNELKENGIEIGIRKNSLEKEELINNIRLKRDDISWVGIDIKGTNLIIKINESDKAPEVIDKSKPCNIIADKDGIISSMVVHSGTPKVKVGDTVKKGDILVEGIMEGKYTGIREVHSLADIFANTYYEKEEKGNLLEQIETKTGNEQKKTEIKINKIKINFNKRLLNFEKYDTIVTNNKIRVFSNYYLPIEILETTYLETKNETKKYTAEELVEKIKVGLQKQLDEELNLKTKENVQEELEVQIEGETVFVKLVYIVQERIGTKELK